MSLTGYQKQTKAQVKAKLRRLKPNRALQVCVLPCKAHPSSEWISPLVLTLDATCLITERSTGVTPFDKHIDSYEYYNCNKQVGSYASFYIREVGII